MRFSVFYLKNPTLGVILNQESHVCVLNYFHADDATSAFHALDADRLSDHHAADIAGAGLRRFSTVPGDILVSEKGDVIRKTRDSLETLAVTPQTVHFLLRAAPLKRSVLDRKLERCSFGTLRAAFSELAHKSYHDIDEDFPPEEDLPF